MVSKKVMGVLLLSVITMIVVGSAGRTVLSATEIIYDLNLTPSDNLTQDIGSSSKYWNNIYTNNLTANNDLNVNGTTTSKYYCAQLFIDNNSVSVGIGVKDTWYNITGWNNSSTPHGFITTTSNMTAEHLGKYAIHYSLSFSGAKDNNYYFGVFVNETLQPQCRGRAFSESISDINNIAKTCHVSLTPNDIVTMRVLDSSGAGDITIYEANLNGFYTCKE